MTMRHSPVRRIILAVLAAAALAIPAAAQAPPGRPAPLVTADPNEGARLPPSLADGLPIERVYVHIVNPTGDAVRDGAQRAALEDAFALKAGGTFSDVFAGAALRDLLDGPEVDAAEYRLYRSDDSAAIILALIVRTRAPEAKPPAAVKGLLPARRWSEFPVIYEDNRSQVRAMVNPSFGVYDDEGAWLGNPTAFNPRYDVPDSLAWPEFGLEVGGSAIVQLGSAPVYVYGAASTIVSGTLANDVFSSEEHRTHIETEKLYGGLLVARKGGRAAFDLSVGRQKFSLNRHLVFGFVLGSTNGGDRGASFLSPRQAQDLVVNARLRVGKTVIQGFLNDPNELPVADSRSRYAGFNVRYNDNRRLDASFTFAGAIRSTAAYTVPDGRDLRRDGLRLVNPRVKWDRAFGVPGLWVEGEVGREWHDDFDMSAYAYGAWAGYRFSKAPWRPAVLYRYAVFSGDDPATAAYERFDPLLGGVQRDWLQGMVMVKLANNANISSHRVEASVRPRRGMEWLVDFYVIRARESNNLGGARPFQAWPSRDLGYEVTPTLQWSITPNLFLQALVSVKVPGKGMADALPQPARTWASFQASLYAGSDSLRGQNVRLIWPMPTSHGFTTGSGTASITPRPGHSAAAVTRKYHPAREEPLGDGERFVTQRLIGEGKEHAAGVVRRIGPVVAPLPGQPEGPPRLAPHHDTLHDHVAVVLDVLHQLALHPGVDVVARVPAGPTARSGWCQDRRRSSSSNGR